ncbi:MAG: tetratricopeptide repeat protein [Sphingobium sp.]|nr:tetratricopeptide repeat protein [Sphingobium sp.]MBP6111447.1 tetratricopeptide repeat protein [Sphingobium sp.]MBP8670141.1 tetratricopeptide repeat protein [Sphingobium sp.]MBP9157354.1 tetratricopeptide repeat protein [Sphingobium sp.]
MMRQARGLLTTVLALLVAQPVLATSGGKVGLDGQRLDAYVQARMAEGDGALRDAARSYAQALMLDPASPEVARRAYRQAMLAGDRALALKAALLLDEDGMLPPDGVVLLLADALERGRWKEARTLLERIEREGNFAFIVPFMQSWVSMKDGPYDPPVVPVDKPYAVFAVRYLEEQLLLQRLALGDAAGAADTYMQARARGTAFGPAQHAAIAARFAMLGRSDIAQDAKAEGGAAGKGCAAPAEAFTPQYGLSKLLYRLALDLIGQGEPGATLSISRLAGFADKADDDARLLVARAALVAELPDEARSETEKIGTCSPAYHEAQSVRLSAMIAAGDDAEAVTEARRLAGDARGQRLLGDMLVQTGDPRGAVAAYGRARAQMQDKDDPALLLQLAAAHEQAGDWAAAKPLLEKVVERAPDSAAALNYLGYAMADRGEEVARAIALLERANRIAPRQPAFIDSLGWALFKAGQADKALPLIEGAVAAAPGNPEINEHLGDILWALGRHFEARAAWRAALAGLDKGENDAKVRTRLTSKLDVGAGFPSPTS